MTSKTLDKTLDRTLEEAQNPEDLEFSWVHR